MKMNFQKLAFKIQTILNWYTFNDNQTATHLLLVFIISNLEELFSYMHLFYQIFYRYGCFSRLILTTDEASD